MKKTVLNVAVLSLSISLLYAFPQMKSLHMISSHLAKDRDCSISDVIEIQNTMPCSRDSSKQTIISETIPKFHQQLRTFSPF